MKKAWDYFRKNHLHFFLPLLVLSATIGPFVSLNFVAFTFFVIYSFSYYVDWRRGRTNIAERKLMARKGLTYRQWRDLNFVKKWGETRTAGPVKYILIFGGLYFGFGLCFGACWWMLKYQQDAIEFAVRSLENTLILIGYSYLGGFLAAVCLAATFWVFNEKKFTRLMHTAH